MNDIVFPTVEVLKNTSCMFITLPATVGMRSLIFLFCTVCNQREKILIILAMRFCF